MRYITEGTSIEVKQGDGYKFNMQCHHDINHPSAYLIDNVLLSFLVEHLLGIQIGYVFTKREFNFRGDRIFIGAS